ncbi:acetyltransferase [Bacillus timonensis]|uniref:Acetyltransferase n=1 Tax=Bacillus timonensis TaxID=1033734 RepID=A0A4S3PVU3_9BACI|nr:acetyltransferase [Bacillus timonensis]THE13949.1 acetyltransferase [Bacillus timonensis]
MNNIIVFGSGGHSKVVIDIIEKAGKFNILGLIDPFKQPGTKVMDYEILGSEDILPEIGGIVAGGIVALADNWKRSNIVNKILSINPQFQFITAIHPSVQIGRDVSIGNGTVVMANAVINSNTRVNTHCIINTKASLDPDCVLGEFVTLAPGATVAGGVTIGKYSVISLGANVIHNRTIGEHTVIGASSTVLHDVDSHVLAYGTPARIIKRRMVGEEYLQGHSTAPTIEE